MLSPFIRSMLYAVEGLWHAVTTERNLKYFFFGVVASIALAAAFRLDPTDWIVILVTGGTFLAIELINTSLERLSGAFYRHMEDSKDHQKHRAAMKATKDVAAGAALVMALAWVAVITIVLWPYVFARAWQLWQILA